MSVTTTNSIHVNLGSFLRRYNLRDESILCPVSSRHLQKIASRCCKNWRDLPVVLDMEDPSIWRDIDLEVADQEGRRSRFFSQWKSEKGSDASYKALISALLELKCQQDAEYVCQLILETTILRDTTDPSTELARQQNFEKIKGCFANIIRKVSAKLSASNIDLTEFRSYVANLFPPGKFIENTSNIAEIFNALTQNGLWDYCSCTALDYIYKEFGGGDEELQGWVNNYKAELAGFMATTKIIDFIKVEDSIADPNESISQYKARFDKEYYTKLTIKLERRVTEESLTYIDDFWMSIANLFSIPPLVTLLESIREGCTEVTWLVSTQAVAKVESAVHTIVAFEQAQVTLITLEDKTLYALDKGQEQEKLIDELQNAIQLKDIMIAQLQKQNDLMQESLHQLQTKEVSHLDLQWEHGTNMPLGMSDYIQAVVVLGKVYVGGDVFRNEHGGDDDDDDDDDANNCIVMEYDTASNEWNYLVPYASRFAMTAINDHLVLVGGLENENRSTQLGVWVEDDMEWIFPYPDMPTGRFDCSAVVYKQWLIVAGGVGLFSPLSCVEVLDIANQQWHTGPSLPLPLRCMKISVVKDACYFIGDGSFLPHVQPACCVSMKTLIASISPDSAINEMDDQVWKEIAEPPNRGSSPLSISGHLCSAGGFDEHGFAVSSIYQYLPVMKEWVKVGDLPSPRYFFACAALRSSEILIIGGNDYSDTLQKSIDIATMDRKAK